MDDDQGYFAVIPTQLIDSGKPLKALLYGVISTYAKKSGICYASNQTLAKKIGNKSIPTVKRYLRELIKDGWIDMTLAVTEGNKRFLTLPRVMGDPTSGHGRSEGRVMGDPHSNISKSNIISNTNITNVIVAKPQNKELNELLNYAKQNNFPFQGTIRGNRYAASNFLKKYGLEKSQRLVMAAVQTAGQPYAPTINDFNQLYRKAADLVMFYQKEGAKNERVVRIDDPRK